MLEGRLDGIKKGFFIFFCVILVLIITRPSSAFYTAFGIMSTVVGITSYFAVKNNQFDTKKTIYSALRLFAIVYVLWYINHWLAHWGWLGLSILVLGYSAWRMYAGREFLKDGLDRIADALERIGWVTEDNFVRWWRR